MNFITRFVAVPRLHGVSCGAPIPRRLFATPGTDTQKVEVQDKSNQPQRGDRERERSGELEHRREARRVGFRNPKPVFLPAERVFEDFFTDLVPSMARMDPFRELDRSMRKAFREMERSLPTIQPGFDWAPSADITEAKDAYLIHANLPGVKKDNIQIEVDHNILTIKGERKDEKEDKDENTKIYKKESMYGTFLRRFTLPEDIDSKQIKASYKDGVLTLTIPKPLQSEAVHVPIEEESSQQSTTTENKKQ